MKSQLVTTRVPSTSRAGEVLDPVEKLNSEKVRSLEQILQADPLVTPNFNFTLDGYSKSSSSMGESDVLIISRELKVQCAHYVYLQEVENAALLDLRIASEITRDDESGANIPKAVDILSKARDLLRRTSRGYPTQNNYDAGGYLSNAETLFSSFLDHSPGLISNVPRMTHAIYLLSIGRAAEWLYYGMKECSKEIGRLVAESPRLT